MENSVMRSKYTLVLLSVLTAWATFALPAARAGVYTYGAVQRTVNAGILLNGASATAPDKDPYVFYILSQRPDVRPFGWNIVNPLAPKSVTAQVKARWTAYAAGQPVSPNMAAYWEVSLPDAAPADLAQYDVLLLNLSNSQSITAVDAEKLRRFVDAGGVLWIEQSSSGGAIDITTTGGPLFSPLNTLDFNGSGGTLALPGAPYREALLSTPYLLSEQEIRNLGAGQNGQWSHRNGSPLLQSVLNAGTDNSLSAGQYGAGFVVASSAQVANAVNEYVNPSVVGNSGPYSGINYAAAPSGDLKLVCNIIASAGEAPHERQNSHQQGGAANALSAAALSWTYTFSAGTTAPGVNQVTGSAINGQIAYVTDASGTLHAFDINPAEDLDGNGNPDDGDINTNDYSAGQPYDELWKATVGAFASAPTVAFDPKLNKTMVFVEKNNGDVLEYDTTPTGGATPFRAPVATFTSGTPSSPPTVAGQPTAYDNATGAAPAPTVYDGKLYAGQPQCSLFVVDLANPTTNKGNFVVNIDSASNSGGEFVSASPTVGIQTESQRGPDTNDILTYVTTNHGVYTVFCGARGELLQYVAGAGTGYNTKLQTLKPTGSSSGRIFTTVSAPYPHRTYTVGGGGLPTSLGLAYSATAPPDFTSANVGSVFADYDIDFLKTVAAAGTDTGPLTRTGYSASSQTLSAALGTNAKVSAAALDHFGNAYFTVYDSANPAPVGASSSLFCIHDSYASTASTIAWRFRLPVAADDTPTPFVDADGTSYSALNGFYFVGAPVTDAQGFVYALATNGTSAAVLCFNGQAAVTVDVFEPGTAQPISNATYTQPIPAGSPTNLNEFGVDATTQPLGTQQYSDKDGSGHVTITNFGTITGMNSHELSPNFSEPQPVTVQYTPSTGAAGGAVSTLTTVVRPLHTNLLWFTREDNIPNPAGLALVGNRLFFGDGNGNVHRVIADPQAEGVALVNKVVNPTAANTEGTPMVSSAGSSGLAQIGGTLSAANGTLIINGTNGVSCFADRTTLVVDASRVMEVDAEGQAAWVVDSTTRVSTEGGGLALQNGTAPLATDTGQTVTTDLALARPSSVTQLTRNDYLIADTGNNRAVRFDRSGRVIWELSKFQDPSGLLTAGEPDTLNQPTSVQIFRETLRDSANKVIGTDVHYLVSDSGNSRVVEITDRFGADLTPDPTYTHRLTWISRTADKQGRNYRYGSASYFYAKNNLRYVIALVTNTRIAALPTPFVAGKLSPANRDAPGGSVVLLDYVPVDTTVGTQKGGYISSLFSNFTASLKTAPAAGRYDVTNTVTPTTLQVRNPRYLKPYTSAAGVQRFLLADDNGVFDMDGNFVASWGFTQADYKAMQNPLVGATGNNFRAALPFIPTCVQRLTATDKLTSGALVNHYLVTASYSQGESVHDPALAGLGGEAFETSVTAGGVFLTDSTSGGGFGGHTLSRPGNTSPLEQPTFAYRLQ